MQIKTDVYYKNKTTGNWKIINLNIDQNTLDQIAEEQTKYNLPLWMTDEWEFQNANIISVDL